jgi:hypothetical protein
MLEIRNFGSWGSNRYPTISSISGGWWAKLTTVGHHRPQAAAEAGNLRVWGFWVRGLGLKGWSGR